MSTWRRENLLFSSRPWHIYYVFFFSQLFYFYGDSTSFTLWQYCCYPNGSIQEKTKERCWRLASYIYFLLVSIRGQTEWKPWSQKTNQTDHMWSSWEMLEWKAQAGIKIAGRNINNLRYADDTTLMVESEEELLMTVKEKSEKAGLKLSIQKKKIIASVPITSWQIDGATMEIIIDFIVLGSKITADGDCSHEIKRCFLHERKAVTTLDSILKRRHITLPTKVHIVKTMVFPVFMYRCECWTIKKVEHQRIEDFELWCWGRLLRVPCTAGRSNQSILKEISPGYSLEGLMLKLKLQ